MIIADLATIPAVLALVNLCKGLGVPPKLAPVTALVFGVACELVVCLCVEGNYLHSAVLGLLLGLSASGLYDVSQGQKAPAAISED